MTWWKALIALAILGGLAAITVAGLKERPPPATEVQLGTAKRSPITRTVTGAGKVQPATTVKISSSISGDLIELTAWRRKLHQHPEISGEEAATAREVVAFLGDTNPDRIVVWQLRSSSASCSACALARTPAWMPRW